MAILGSKINVEDVRIGDKFEFAISTDAYKFENALYAQARKKGLERPIFGWGLSNKKMQTLTVIRFKPIKSRLNE